MALKIQPPLSELKAILHLRDWPRERLPLTTALWGLTLLPFAHRQVPSASFLTTKADELKLLGLMSLL